MALLAGSWLVGASGSIRAATAPQQQVPPSSAAASPSISSAAAKAVFEKYCFTCHNQRLHTAGLTLDTLDVDDVSANEETWERVIGKLIRHVGQSDIRLITEDDVLSWKLSLIDSGLGPKTIKNHLTIAKTLFNFAVGNKLIPSNPASKVTYKGQSDPARMPRSYSDAEAKLVLGEARQQGKGASICDV